jgi:signal peptidase I
VAVRRETRRSAAAGAAQEKERIDATTRGPGSTGRWAWEWLKSFLVAFGLFLILRTFLVEAFRIPTGSMENTLLVGDFLLVNKAVFGAGVPFTSARTPAFARPDRGDIVIFVPPHEPGKNYVKRLIGMPDDTVEMHAKALFVNGQLQTEPYVRHSDPNDVYSPSMFWQCDHAPAGRPRNDCRPTRDNWGPVVVPAGRYFMLGDNRDDSEDSRYWGFVQRAGLRGKPLFIYYSFDPRSRRRVPWISSIRWDRIGHTVH